MPRIETSNPKFDEELVAVINRLIKEWFENKGLHIISMEYDVDMAAWTSYDRINVVFEIPAKDFFVLRLAGKENELCVEISEYMDQVLIGLKEYNA